MKRGCYKKGELNEHLMNKLFSRTIITYVFILSVIFIIKLIGLDYFGLDTSNPLMCSLGTLIDSNLIINNIIYFIPLMLNHYVVLSVVLDDNSKRMIIYNLCFAPLFYVFQATKLQLFGIYSSIIESLYFIILIYIYNKGIDKKIIIKYMKLMLFIFLIQVLSTFTRFNYSIEYVTNSISNVILNFDYIIMLIIIYKLNFMKGEGEICGYQVAQYSFSHQLTSLTKQLRKFQIKSLSNKEKFEFIATWIIYLLWNIFTLYVILLVAKLNDTVVECIIILSAFWINKRVFGKAFHMKNAINCFILSNISYYCLNRITSKVEISILVPIILGISLSYFTSKLVKENKVKLKRGMTEEQVKELLTKINADPIDYKICDLYYTKGYSDLKTAYTLGYSEINIKKRKQKINKALKELII